MGVLYPYHVVLPHAIEINGFGSVRFGSVGLKSNNSFGFEM